VDGGAEVVHGGMRGVLGVVRLGVIGAFCAPPCRGGAARESESVEDSLVAEAARERHVRALDEAGRSADELGSEPRGPCCERVDRGG
jgi:hypothetical protein